MAPRPRPLTRLPTEPGLRLVALVEKSQPTPFKPSIGDPDMRVIHADKRNAASYAVMEDLTDQFTRLALDLKAEKIAPRRDLAKGSVSSAKDLADALADAATKVHDLAADFAGPDPTDPGKL